MSIQILQHEFLGPVRLSEWGPPMEKVVYVVLARDKDRFHLVYADVCEHTDDRSFFVSNGSFKCWMERAGSEENLYLAILPMFASDPPGRRFVLDRIINSTKPPCNGVNQGGSRTPL
ncbi:MAG: hypothetical protein IS632_02235 [Thaumarchaeota archaeon]|nr:hypothetical protein [Nitrososphaerota archaeon]